MALPAVKKGNASIGVLFLSMKLAGLSSLAERHGLASASSASQHLQSNSLPLEGDKDANIGPNIKKLQDPKKSVTAKQDV